MKGRILIQLGNGKMYRVAKTWRCRNKRDCDLFERGVCDYDGYTEHLPCDAICKVIADHDLNGFNCCYKEVKE